jgi:hypothetical protein
MPTTSNQPVSWHYVIANAVRHNLLAILPESIHYGLP